MALTKYRGDDEIPRWLRRPVIDNPCQVTCRNVAFVILCVLCGSFTEEVHRIMQSRLHRLAVNRRLLEATFVAGSVSKKGIPNEFKYSAA